MHTDVLLDLKCSMRCVYLATISLVNKVFAYILTKLQIMQFLRTNCVHHLMEYFNLLLSQKSAMFVSLSVCFQPHVTPCCLASQVSGQS
jgi:hypothetical protein